MLEFQSRVPGSMSILTLTSSGIQIGGTMMQKVDGCGSHLSFLISMDDHLPLATYAYVE